MKIKTEFFYVFQERGFKVKDPISFPQAHATCESDLVHIYFEIRKLQKKRTCCFNYIKFLMLDELDPSNVERSLVENIQAVSIENGSFSWDKESECAVLENINLVIPNRSLTAVIGRVGVGKSSLLSSLLGEMQKLNGNVCISGTIAYISQQAWIENATIRDNILFGSDYDPKKFEAIIDACALRSDFDLFPAGDMTEIGEKGVNLSGGQKQRMALARAVYHDADIYLLIVVIKDKTISQQGSYAELMAQEEGTFKALIKEFGHAVVFETQTGGLEAQSYVPSKKSISDQEDKQVAKNDGKLMIKEDAGKGLAKAYVFYQYSKAAGVLCVVASFALLICAQGATVGTGIWLDNWSTKTTDAENGNVNGFYLGIYAAIVIAASALTLMTNLTMYIKVGQNAAKVLHSKMLSGVMQSPMSFFDTNPLGRITNRFVGDIQIVDESLRYYLKTAQSIQRINRLTNSPVYAIANASFAGASTLRAFNKTGNYITRNNELQDDLQASFLGQITCNKWLQFRMECLGSCICFGAALFIVVERDRIRPGSAGLSLGYAMHITQYLYHTMRLYGEVQNFGISLERIFEYFELLRQGGGSDDDWLTSGLGSGGDLTNWPSEGKVVFKDFKMRYRESTPVILNGISLTINGGEKVGIVGRTGAGKSSLSAALFRLSEAESGTIEVDGVDISKIGLNKLRTRLTIIPQEPVLFGASICDNIDPPHKFSDEAIWRALESVHLKARFQCHEEGLEQKLKSGGENLSVGERQLFCLARAILRNTKVLVLGRTTIRREFKNATVLTIAHRIQTIMDSDKILVLKAGTVEEFDPPQNLLASSDSAFSKLVAAARIETSIVR
ncbi:P-loop containing nucleoside triphosphate hydrolase protein [Obelidium mucronatum]|nr:P-loop containing nucleoside triphosphate hydrolase protein [Obelidium mucronatum]